MRHEGHIQAGSVDKDVTFVAEADDDINNQIDTAYHTKYGRHGPRWVNPMVAAEARAARISSCRAHEAPNSTAVRLMRMDFSYRLLALLMTCVLGGCAGQNVASSWSLACDDGFNVTFRFRCRRRAGSSTAPLIERPRSGSKACRPANGQALPTRVLAEYDRTARTFAAGAWMIGRITGEVWVKRRTTLAAGG